VKETDDGKPIDVSDVGSIPTTSTKPEEVKTWANKPARMYDTPGLCGRNVHGVSQRPSWYYYTENEWSRIGMLGPRPPDRIKGGEPVFDGADENLQEESDTKI